MKPMIKYLVLHRVYEEIGHLNFLARNQLEALAYQIKTGADTSKNVEDFRGYLQTIDEILKELKDCNPDFSQQKNMGKKWEAYEREKELENGDETGEDRFWAFIKESKENKPYLSSGAQFENLVQLLPSRNRREMAKEWARAYQKIRAKGFDKLHIDNGGIICSGDDGFYMDFGNWVVAQGKELFDAIQRDGHKAVLLYIEEHDIAEEDYTFECMVYCFQD